MLIAERRKQILDLVTASGGVKTTSLAEHLGVSLATVRRDLEALEREGFIVRTHGGAVSLAHSTAFEPKYRLKLRLRQEEKERIGRAAASLIREGDAVIFDSGSTALYVARNARGKRISAVTLDLPVAMELADDPTTDVLVVGGKVRTGLYAVVGPFAEEMLRQIHVNRFFLAADAVHLEEGITNATAAEVPVKRLAIRAAQEVILVADSSKFGRLNLVKVCDLGQVHRVVTDSNLPADQRKGLEELGIEVILA